ncbi:prepilin-type N-terminal cleavage/methylation domain-containing protein [Paenibacillus sp. JX-17]|uniref:Prepilin-type N-terminal cleavage/methylation domain-containing protein n=1 Tax=Paenibacillus lacisoli TaxID=3064525 RepID=A0ABT9CCJ1_9BACL|nr:prepilin-type N-terminal cleavage/methylation domain-containing protein [Paenibacillus sp. JX-17]MDO7906595.1 prepilin-type N-terminal cleavage/methylation domain-containing protein [Paenibacillus sp. JX-17]
MLAKVLKRVKKEEKGFTLIELLAVIVIIGIIAVIAIPMISNLLNKSRDNADVATARQVYDAARMYITSEKNGDFKSVNSVTIASATGDSLVSKGYLESELYLPSNKKKITGGTVTFDKGNLSKVTINYEDSGTKTEEFEAEEVLKSEKK